MKFIFIVVFLSFFATNLFAQKPDINTLPDATLQTLDNTSIKLYSLIPDKGYTLITLSSVSPNVSKDLEPNLAELPLKIISVEMPNHQQESTNKGTKERMKGMKNAVERLNLSENVYLDVNRELENTIDAYYFSWLVDKNKKVIYYKNDIVAPKDVPELLRKIDSVKGNKFSLSQLEYIDKFLENCKPMFVKNDTLFFENGYGFNGKTIFNASKLSPYVIIKDNSGNDAVQTLKNLNSLRVEEPIFSDVYALADCFYNNELYYIDFDESSDVGEFKSKIFKITNTPPYKQLIQKFNGTIGNELIPYQDGMLFSYKPFGKNKFEIWKTNGTENSANQVNDGSAGRMIK
jgi:hypothetical protein